MKSILFAAVALTLVSIANLASAAPQFWYNPANGGIWLTNDTGAPLGAISILSAGNNVKTDPGLFTQIPGATFDPGDLPLGFTYLNFPPTDTPYGIHVGNVIQPGTPVPDLSGIYYLTLSNGQSQPMAIPTLLPEPSSCLASIISLIGFSCVARRGRR